jgi:hypothetical protein
VRLHPGGAVDVRIENHRPADGVTLRVFRGSVEDDEAVRAATPNSDGTCAIEGLLPRTYVVAAQVSEDWIVLAHAKVRVAQGERAAVVLVAGEPPPAAPPAGPRARLRGTLYVPPGWDDESLTLNVSSVDDDTEFVYVDVPLGDISQRERRTIRWDAGEVPPGAYEIRIEPMGHEHAFRVSPGTRRRDVHVVVPPPATVHVDVVDEHGSPVAVRGWPSGLSEASRTARVPVGNWFFPMVVDERYGADVTPVVVRPGENRIRLVVHPLYRVRVVLEEQGAVVPPEPVWTPRVEAVDHDGRVVEGRQWSSVVAPARTIVVDRPGRYRLRFEAIPGYRTPPDREIVVRDTDEVQDVVYELEPE